MIEAIEKFANDLKLRGEKICEISHHKIGASNQENQRWRGSSKGIFECKTTGIYKKSKNIKKLL